MAGYAVLACLLLWTRLAALGQSLWYDEILTVTSYVRAGPGEILAGPYIPNNHELFSLLSWATTSAFGETEVTLRLWSTIPFLLGVFLVTAWLHIRVSSPTALLFLFFSTASPMLLDLSREARGYGLAFLAMSVLIVSAFEAERTGRTSLLAAFFAAGLVGTWTLPIFGVAFVATALAVLSLPELRRRAALGLAASIPAIALWYAPHIDDLIENSGQHDGAPISWLGLGIAPMDRVLIPGMLWFSDTILTAYPGRLVVIVTLGALVVSSPLLRTRRPALLLGSGVVATLVALWVARIWFQPRFVSFLLVPLFIVLADGTGRAIRSFKPAPQVRPLIAACMIIFALAAFAGAAAHLLRRPMEAWKAAAAAAAQSSAQDTPVLAYVSHADGLRYYLDAAVRPLRTPEVRARVCARSRTVVFVTQPYDIEPVDVPCLRRLGVRHVRLDQHSRGGEINVYIVPPADRPKAPPTAA